MNDQHYQTDQNDTVEQKHTTDKKDKSDERNTIEKNDTINHDDNETDKESISQPETNQTINEEKAFMQEIYDRLPFTYKQVDLFTKILIAITIAFVIFAVVMSNR